MHDLLKAVLTPQALTTQLEEASLITPLYLFKHTQAKSVELQGVMETTASSMQPAAHLGKGIGLSLGRPAVAARAVAAMVDMIREKCIFD